MWATALIVYGPEARTGLDLLQRLVATRLQTAGMSSAIEAAELRSAASYCAHRLWPATASTAGHVLELLKRWRTSEEFAPRPAEDVLRRLGEAALLEVGDEVAFPHRLIATILAAEHIVAGNGKALDQELAPFVAALADDDGHLELLHQTLLDYPVFVLARYLRLSPPRRRNDEANADVRRLADAYRLWSSPHGELDVMMSSTWIAWRPASVASARVCGDHEYGTWRSESEAPVQFWPSPPFTERSPEFIAAVYVLGRFRTRVLELDPGVDQAATVTEEDVRALLPDETTLTRTVAQTLRDRRDARLKLLAKLGLGNDKKLQPQSGEPLVTITTPPGEAPLVRLEWRIDHPHGVISPSGVGDMLSMTTSVRHLLSGGADKVAFDDLERAIEEELGCRLSAQNWTRPELVPAWAW